MKEHTLEYQLVDLDCAIAMVQSYMSRARVVTFTGDLGAGKTTLIRALLKKLGVTQPITSPTFTYMNVYTLKDGSTIYHFDLYRLQDVNSFIELGFNEYLYQEHSWCFIEWPAIIELLLTHDVCDIHLMHTSADSRTMKIDCR